MWSSIGSLRESAQRKLSTVRENALAAAAVASEVLVTAATEETDTPENSEWDQFPLPADNPYNSSDEKETALAQSENADADWDAWTTTADNSSKPDPTIAANVQPPPPPPPTLHPVKSGTDDSIPPPPMHHVPPPPLGATDPSEAMVTVMKRPPRSSRYVVTGTKVTSAEPSILAPPRPPGNPQIKAPTSESEPPRDVSHDEPLDATPVEQNLTSFEPEPFTSTPEHSPLLPPPSPPPILEEPKEFSGLEAPLFPTDNAQKEDVSDTLVTAAFDNADTLPYSTDGTQEKDEGEGFMAAIFGNLDVLASSTNDGCPKNSDISRDENINDLQSSGDSQNFVDDSQEVPNNMGSTKLKEEINKLKAMYSSSQTILEQKDAEIRALRDDFQVIRNEKNALLVEKERADEEKAIAKRNFLELRDKLADDSDEIHRAVAERDDAKENVRNLEVQIQQLVQERDSSIAQFDSFKSEVNTTATTEHEQFAKQLEQMRELLSRSETERNEACNKLEQLELRMEHNVDSAESRVVELERQVNSLSENLRATSADRDARDQLLEELSNDLRSEQNLLKEKEIELENFKRGLKDDEVEKAGEKARLEATSSQVKELEEAFERVIVERNELHSEQENIKAELEKQRNEAAAASSKTDESNRKVTAIIAQLQESESRHKSHQAELADLHVRIESLTTERDALIQQRTVFVSQIEDVPVTMKTLTAECEEKSNEVTALQRQLKSAMAKVTKLTAQRNKILHQRDDAGARLNAAGSEFMVMNGKLKNALTSNAELAVTVQNLQNERDEALQKVVKLSGLTAEVEEQKVLVAERENLIRETEQVLSKTQTELRTAEDARRIAENGLRLTEMEVQKLNDMNSITGRELEERRAECKALADKEVDLRNSLERERELVIESRAALKDVRLEMVSSIQRWETEKELLSKQLSSEKDTMVNLNAKIQELHDSLEEKNESLSSIRTELVSSLSQSDLKLDNLTVTEVAGINLSYVRDPDFRTRMLTMTDSAFVESYGMLHQLICGALCDVVEKLNDMVVLVEEGDRARNAELTEKINSLERDVHSLSQDLNLANQECARLAESKDSYQKTIDESKTLITELESNEKKKVEELESSRLQVRKLQEDLESLSVTLAEERSYRDAFSAEEKEKMDKQIEAATVHVQAMWTILQDALNSNILQDIIAESERSGGDESMSSVSLMVIRGTRVLSDEIERLLKMNSDFNEKLTSAQAEIDSVWERTRVAEKERDSARAARDKAERDVVAARNNALEEASEEAEIRISQLEEELEHTREDVNILQDSLEKSETENSNMRDSYNEFTARANQTTRKLEDAEENVAYLQDEVASMKEDLEMKTSELNASQKHRNELQSQLLAVRDEKDKSQNSFREIELVMETHKNAEENLQIAIEQLEAEQETIIERKTQDLQKRLDESINAIESMKAKVKEAEGVFNQLSLRDEEITELRTALGRLSDERVELKLELEKSLSRLNHPDGGGQLIDRQVIRQLLVNYFRVGTARRRDVLELMSRILAFSDTDMVTVGLKRVNLSERIGSLLQPPDLDGNTLPPIGNVSDKWIEFLMKESVEEDDDF